MTLMELDPQPEPIRRMTAFTTSLDVPDHEITPPGMLDLDAAFRMHGAMVLRYAASRVGQQVAEDVTAETFAEAWRSRAAFDSSRIAGAEGWLLGIATNVISKQRRAERRWLRQCSQASVVRSGDERVASDEQVLAAERLDGAGDARALANALRHIPPRERDALLLHELAGLEYQQVADALDIPVGTVRSRISRARARLSERLITTETKS